MRLQLINTSCHIVQNFIDKWSNFTSLNSDKMPPTFVRNLDEGVTGHVLNTVVRF